MAKVENAPPEEENRNHTYHTHHIPWFVHLLWLAFWIFAIAYIFNFLVPAIRTEMLAPP